ncbi:DUF2232 domain-containing protein [Mongoliimonas terrestris]|uniref:DUF2232 domain-containing protein n=1 Tax=Mongoliimonas terrestris TaxID=1709001 RepID=UPI000AEA6B5E|nr:DUF2232 domain-containing protein [Mongoliimonas terrestris]
MTLSQALMGLAGGFVSALLFSAVLGGGALGAPLLLLSPLPILIASLGWGTIAGALAGLAAAVFVGVTTAPELGFGYLLVASGPAAWYGHVIGLARPRDEDGSLEWYPLWRVLTSMTIITAVTLVVAGWLVGLDIDEMSGTLADTLAALNTDPTVPTPDRQVMLDATRVYVRIMPVTTAMLWMSVMALVIWLGARVVKVSGRLQRPWDSIPDTIGLPATFVPVFALAAVAALSDSPLGLMAGAVAGAVGMGFAFQGFAVVHVLTRGLPARTMILGLLYTFTFLFSLPLLFMALAGMADAIRSLRGGKKPNAAGT